MPLLASALLGSWITARATLDREGRKERLEFVTRQLNEFYGPLYAKRLEIRTLSVLRVDLNRVADEINAERVAAHLSPRSDARQAASEADRKRYGAQVAEENRIFLEVMLPAYRSMIDVFRDKMGLADHRTRLFFSDLVRYVAIWERSENKTAHPESQRRLNATESSLEPFYQHIEKMVDALQNEISGAGN